MAPKYSSKLKVSSYSYNSPYQIITFNTNIDKNQLLAERLLDLPFFLLYCLAFLCFFDAMTEISYNWFLNLCVNKNVLVMVGMKLVT